MAYVSDKRYRRTKSELQQQIDDLAARLDRLEREELPETAVTQADDVTPQDKDTTLADIVGVPVANALEQAGYATLKAINDASDEDLTAIKGVGGTSISKLREAASK